jgi:hypothetical protein
MRMVVYKKGGVENHKHASKKDDKVANIHKPTDVHVFHALTEQ